MGCQPGSLSSHGLGDKAVTLSCSCWFHLQNGRRPLPVLLLTLSSSFREREGEMEGEDRCRGRETFFFQTSCPVCPGLHLPLRAKCTTMSHSPHGRSSFCSLLIPSSHTPSATHQLPQIPYAPISSPQSAAIPSILSPQTIFPITFLQNPLPSPAAHTYPHSLPTDPLFLVPDSILPLVPLCRPALMLSPKM